MRQVQLQEEDAQLSSLVSEVEAGESVTILRSGKPVAQLIPFPVAKEIANVERAMAIRRMKAIMNKGYDLGIVWNGRDELYERD